MSQYENVFMQDNTSISFNFSGVDGSYFSEAFGKMCRKIVSEMALDAGRRVDGRGQDQVKL